MIIWGVLQGLLVLILIGSIFTVALKSGLPETEVRALSFFSLVASFIGLIFANRSFDASVLKALTRKNVALVFVISAVGLVLGLTVTVPFMAELFRFGPLHFDDLLVVLASGLFVLFALDAAKLILFRTNGPKPIQTD